MFKKSVKYKKGFSVLFASLTGSLVLAIGLAILSITIKQITLASAGRESQLAFYAADTGTECALFLDAGGGNIDVSGNPICPQGIFGIPANDSDGDGRSDNIEQCGMEGDDYTFGGGTQYKCTGVSFQKNPRSPSGNLIGEAVFDSSGKIVRTNVSVNTGSPDNLCFNITIDKTREVEGLNEGNIITKIISRGYSTCDKTSRNRFERAIKLKY